jgi:hypothetical protein
VPTGHFGGGIVGGSGDAGGALVVLLPQLVQRILLIAPGGHESFYEQLPVLFGPPLFLFGGQFFAPEA